MTVFSPVTPCSVIEIDWYFRGTYCLDHLGLHPSSPWWWRQFSTRLREFVCTLRSLALKLLKLQSC